MILKRDYLRIFLRLWPFQFIDREPSAVYNKTNSPLENAHGNEGFYCRVDGLAFDKEGNLWMTNSEVSKAIKILDKEGKWHSLSVESLNGNTR